MTTREERAAGRRARREKKPDEQPERGTDPREAAREAATRALAAATVSAVRALASRATEEASEPDPTEANQAPEPDVEPEPEPVEREVRPRQKPKEEPRPREGADTGRVQDVLRAARNHLRELHQTDAESVSGLERTTNGWTVDLEVVEVRRIPESTDVLATYRVELDDGLDLLSYERTRRYHRAQADDRGRT